MQAKVFIAMDMPTAESVLKDTNRIMAEQGVSYFLRHGTCLGAVRDGAFIPWDDDLDVGSVLGLHGLTEEKVEQTVAVFRDNGFEATVVHNKLNISVSMQKSGTQMDWTCYRIFGDVIYQWPVVKIPVALHEELKEIDFLGDKFFVPNPPEEYLRLKYGPEWMVPKQAGDFEQDVMDLMTEGSLATNSGRIKSAINRFFPKRYTGSLLVLDPGGKPVVDAEVGIAPTSIISGMELSRTNKDGITKFSLPDHAKYVLSIRYGDHEELLYMEKLAPGVDYVYRPDPDITTGRYDVLTPR
jgi:hypothetical protein